MFDWITWQVLLQMLWPFFLLTGALHFAIAATSIARRRHTARR